MTEFRTSAIRIFANYQICAVAKETAAQARTGSRRAQAILLKGQCIVKERPGAMENTRRIRDLTNVLFGRSSLLKKERALLGISKAGDVIGTNSNVCSGRIDRGFWPTGHGDL
jgi:hypothetical protein